MESNNDKSMLQQLQQGDQKVLGQLYRQYRADFLAWMTSQYACSRDDARDIYQNTMLTFSEKVKEEDFNIFNATLKTYIFGIGKNKYREHRRLHNRYLPLETDAEKQIPEPQPDPTNKEDIQLVHHCLQKLGEPCKSILELYYFHGMSMEEIKEHLVYRNPHTARNMKYKCMQRLKEIFKNELAKRYAYV